VAQALTAPAGGTDTRRSFAPLAVVEGSGPGIETGLLALKRGRAPANPRLVARERLLRRLSAARDVPIALFIAPAGYGKTTALSQWAARDGRPFAWVTLDAADNDPTTLLAAVALVLNTVEPIGWEVFEALSSERPDAATVALQRLARDLSRRETPVVLALDDVHVLETAESRRSIVAVGQALPPGSQLALAGRNECALPVGRLRAQGMSIELRVEDFAMTRSEASSLLSMAGVELSRQQVLRLLHRTEGWPAGLYLAALSLRAQDVKLPDVNEFAGDDRFVSEYVREEFLAELSDRELDFLMRTSVLAFLSAPLCDAVLEGSGSGNMLARLARSNAMLVPLDRSDGSYRYHELFADVLRSELHRREPDRVAQLHRRASKWCEAQRDSAGAIDHAIEAGDVQRAGRLLWETLVPQVGRGNDAIIRARVSRFSEEDLAGNPLLTLAAAGRCLAAGDLCEADRLTSIAGAARRQDKLVRAGVAMLKAGCARQGVTRMGSDAALAQRLLEANSPWRPLGMLFEGVACHLTGDRDSARQRLQDAAHRFAVSAPMFQALCLAQLALMAAEDGDAERAAVLIGRATSQVERCDLRDCPSMALVLAVSAAVRAEHGQLEGASQDSDQALELLAGITDPSPWYEIECHIVLARAALRLHGLTAARDLLATAAAIVGRATDPGVLEVWLQEARAQVDLALDSTAVTDWSLTAAEVRVLSYLPSHLSFREIADLLYVSPNTVKTHARGIYRKLGVSSRGHAVDRARGAGLVPAGGEKPR
jgi:LuxR family transcriptional regulator, maltose regulon positive regulatory protein